MNVLERSDQLGLQIANGVDLNIVNTHQFNSTNLVISLISPWDTKQSAARGIISRIMATANAKFTDQQAISNYLAWMDGADFDCDVLREGNFHILRITLTIPSDRVLKDQSLLTIAIEFLHTVLFDPLASNGSFDQETFKVQQSNMLRYLESLKDDKDYYSFQQLVKLYYVDHPDLIPNTVGTFQEVKNLDASQVFRAYQDLIQNAEMQITVLGDVDKDLVQKQFEKWNFDNRPLIEQSPQISSENHSFVQAKERQSIQQTRLNIGYALPVYYNDEQWFAALLMNGLLGASTQSKLFKIVREKYHLAYYADSIYDSLTGSLFIQAGVNFKEYQQAKRLIYQQVSDLQHGQFTDDELDRIKKEAMNAKISSLDSPSKLAVERSNELILKRHFSFHDWQQLLMQVNKEQVVAVANQLKLQAQFTLLGE